MTDRKANSTRRAFFLRGSALLGTGVATAAGANALMGGPPPTLADDREAIRLLHLNFMAAMEDQAYEGLPELFHEPAQLTLSGLTLTGKAAIANLFARQYREQQDVALHSAYRHNSTQRNDVVTLNNARRQATATFHVEVQISTPLQGDSTAAQMARLQGQMLDRRWERGRFDARYVKVQGLWKMAMLSYSPT